MNDATDFHRIDDVITLFDGLFSTAHRTQLVAGGEEPLYRPAGDGDGYHQVIFTRDYFASALHEISHWCIAGERRRQLEDYGYWYCPDGRDAGAQQAFEAAEVAPQALELLFSHACRRRFHVSVDNLGDVPVDREAFRARVEARAERYRREGLPRRGEAFCIALEAFYREGASLDEAVAMGRERLARGAAEGCVA
ncbi:elongation factor P hydroxylase [Halomonas sp. HP20-15]|uniref:elongation factor P hydroxylase n=1 Tax=Halomonas sp. HP20-15 TaxID=3085901 RepID=UPI002981BD9C|nr:elongation factor P hydroxylase [Halomonas sp. HP20-15]MDW5376759.1 elongation factor P hydroxylase [Halomonas sp. HP20-15]